MASKQALTIAKEALPYLKKDAPSQVAEGLAELLYSRLKPAAVSVANQREVLAHKGIGKEHHKVGDRITASIALKAIREKQMQVSYEKSDLKCQQKNVRWKRRFIPIVEITR